MTKLAKIPTIEQLLSENMQASPAENELTAILNQQPPREWLKEHPTIKNYFYLPIERVEWLLTRIYRKWHVEIRSVQTVANSCVVTVRLYVTNPITGEQEWNDGVGAAPIQTDKGAGATDWNAVKTDGVQKAAPAAESYAIKDAAEKFGKIFGGDAGRKERLNYEFLLPLEELTPAHANWSKAVTAIKSGNYTIDAVLSKYALSSENLEKLKAACQA